MTVQQVLAGVTYIGTLAGAITGIGVLAHFAVVRPIRRFLAEEITTHLVDIKDAIENSGRQLADLQQRLDDHIRTGH